MDVTSFFTMSTALDTYCGDINTSKCEVLNRVKNDPLYILIKESEVSDE